MKLNIRTAAVALQCVLRTKRLFRVPFHCQIEPTNYCNYNCITCEHDTHIKHPAHMPFERFVMVLDRLKPDLITLSGLGEPLLHPKLFDMIAETVRRGIRCNTTTNGSFLDRYAERLAKSGLDLISVSLDAATPATYKKIRGHDSFEKVCSNIHCLVAARGSAPKPAIRLCFVIQASNLSETAAFVDRAADLGVDGVLFQPFLEVGKKTDHKDEILTGLTEESIRTSLNEARFRARERGIKTNAQSILARLHDYFSVQYRGNDDKRILRRCIKPWISVFVTADGIVRPCCSFASTPFDHGNVFECEADTLLNADTMVAFRRDLAEGKAPHWLCARCVPSTLIEFMHSDFK